MTDCTDNNTKHYFDAIKVLLVCSVCLKKTLQSISLKEFLGICIIFFVYMKGLYKHQAILHLKLRIILSQNGIAKKQFFTVPQF